MIFLISAIILLIGCFALYKAYYISKQTKEINKEIEEQNELIAKENEQLTLNKNALGQQIQENTIRLQSITQAIQNSHAASEQTMIACQEAFRQYEKVIENHYQQVDLEYDSLINNLQNAYEETHDKILKLLAQEQQTLDSVRSTRIAAIQAQIKEQEIKEKLTFYCLQPTEQEKDDIQTLERIKPKLHQPRILSMLIWSTYYQKPMTTLCNNILGTSIVCGVYKITNQKTNQCYIGQAADVAKRWKDHAKCGLGIDAPANNKLYKAIQDYGI